MMNLYLEKSHSVASKPYVPKAGSASSPAWREHHLLYPLPKRGQPVQPWRSLNWSLVAIHSKKPTSFFTKAYFSGWQLLTVISPPKFSVIGISERKEEEDRTAEQEQGLTHGRAGLEHQQMNSREKADREQQAGVCGL